MKILIAEDDDVSRRVLQLTLAAAGHDVLATRDGAEALSVLESVDAPLLAILDWMMPERTDRKSAAAFAGLRQARRPFILFC